MQLCRSGNSEWPARAARLFLWFFAIQLISRSLARKVELLFCSCHGLYHRAPGKLLTGILGARYLFLLKPVFPPFLCGQVFSNDGIAPIYSGQIGINGFVLVAPFIQLDTYIGHIWRIYGS